MDIYDFGTTTPSNVSPFHQHAHTNSCRLTLLPCICLYTVYDAEECRREWYTYICCFSACFEKRVKVLVVFLRLPQFLNWYVTIHILIFPVKPFGVYTVTRGNFEYSIFVQHAYSPHMRRKLAEIFCFFAFSVKHFSCDKFPVFPFFYRIFPDAHLTHIGVSCVSHREPLWIYRAISILFRFIQNIFFE